MRACLMPLLILISATLPCSASLKVDSPFGIVCPWGGISSTGIGWVRCGAGATALGNWVDIEKEQGKLNWTNSDNELADISRQNLLALPILGYTPSWASSDPAGKQSAPPKDILMYADFVRTFVNHYKEKINYVEIWNEPDIDFFSGTVDQYTDLLKAGYTAAKSANPKCKVLFGGAAGVNLNFIDDVYKFGGGRYFDVMAVHPYQWGDTFNDEWFISQLRSLCKLLNSHGDFSKPIWLTELGWSTGDKSITEDIQARLLAQIMTTALTLQPIGVEKSFWFCVKDWGGPNYGLLRDDGSRKPAYQAYSVLTRVLDGCKYAGSIDAGKGVRCQIFSRPSGAKVAVVWAAGKERVPIVLKCNDAVIRGTSMLGSDLVFTGKEGKLDLQAAPEPVYLYCSSLSSTKAPDTLDYASAPVKNVTSAGTWISIPAPTNTARPYAVIGDSVNIPIKITNMTGSNVSGWLMVLVPGAEKSPKVKVVIDQHSTATLQAPLSLKADVKEGVSVASVVFETGAGRINSSFPLRSAKGKVIEFPANSAVEKPYLFFDDHSGGAPSVRFNGKWVYKFDLSGAKSVRVRLNVGAHQANKWKVSASRENVNYREILSGASDRSWHECDLSEFVPGSVYLKFEGNDQQLEELILTWR